MKSMNKETFVRLLSACKTFWDKMNQLETALNTTFDQNFMTDIFDSVMSSLDDEILPKLTPEDEHPIYEFAFVDDWGEKSGTSFEQLYDKLTERFNE